MTSGRSSGPLATARSRASLLAIRVGRRLVHGTPVQRWPITGYIHRRVVDVGWQEDIVQTCFRGLEFKVPTKDLTVVPGILGGFYEARELDLFEHLAALSRSIVDVGGNLGVYACLGAYRQPPDGRLVVFEPVPENIDLLTTNLALNGLMDRVEVVPAAVGSAAGELTLHLAGRNIGTHSASEANANAGRGATEQIVVPVHSLDDHPLTSPHKQSAAPVDLLKVDVEGYDGHVLRGARSLLALAKPTLLIEFVPRHLRGCDFDPREFLDLIFSTYENVYAVSGTSGPVKRVDRRALEGEEGSNLVAVHNQQHLAVIRSWADSTKHR